MRHFEELEGEEEEIVKKRTLFKKFKKWTLILFISIFALFIISSLLLEYFPNTPLIYTNLIGGVAFILFILSFFFARAVEKNKLSVKQSFIYQINSLRDFINKEEKSKFLKILKKKTALLELKYSSVKNLKSKGFDVENKVSDFLNESLFRLKYYARKKHLKDEDKWRISLLFDSILEGILKETFAFEGLGKIRYPKKFDIFQIINKIGKYLKNKWINIIFILIISFFILFFLRLIGLLKEFSFWGYCGFTALLLVIEDRLFNKNSNSAEEK